LDKADGPYEIFLAGDKNPAGYVITKMAERGGHLVGYIVDILSVDSSVDDFLIGAALDYFISKKADYSLCRIIREDEVYGSLIAYGFKASGSTPFIYQMFDEKIDLTFFTDPCNWHLTYGDQIDWNWDEGTFFS
jgi:hypothetical protein